MSKSEVLLAIIININLGLILGFCIRCWTDKEFRELAKKMYERIK